jgi:hypothetical protein
MYDLKQAMRALCPEAAEVVKRCLKSDNEKVALLAAQIAFDRGFGRPEVSAEVEMNHKFVIAPDTLPLDEWLATKGQGWAAHRRELQLAASAEKRTSEAPTSVAGHSNGEELTIDLETEPEPEAELPPVDPSKLN